MAFRKLKSCASVACALVSIATFQAYAAQDAGSILREQPKPALPAPVPSQQLEVAPQSEPEKDTGPKVMVNGFEFQGALLISKDELSRLMAPYVGKEYSFADLKRMASTIVAYYIEHGYMARVVVPPQEVKDGVVIFRIIEGKRGDLSFNTQSDRINGEWAQRIIDHRLPKGGPMDLTELGEAMNVLNEQPGVNARVALARGKEEGDSDLNVTAQATPLVTGSVGVNDQGNRATGIGQAQGTVSLNNPTGHFDAASLLANVSQGTDYFRGDYGIAAGDSGLRLGANASYLDYKIVQPSLSATGSHGWARTWGLTASYPFARKTDFSLSLTGGYDYQEFDDVTNAGETSNRSVPVARFGFNGFMISKPGQLLHGGTTSFGANLGIGHSKEHNAGALAADSTTRQVEGRFAKLDFNLGHIRPINDDWSLDANLQGQISGSNLDSAERFHMGGPDGVRAYPVSEAIGDEGFVLNLNARRRINDRLSASVFFDAGGVRLNHNTWTNWNAGNPSLDNSYMLYGAGIGADWRVNAGTLVNAVLATPIGPNPGHDVNGKNADGFSNRPHFWVGLRSDF